MYCSFGNPVPTADSTFCFCLTNVEPDLVFSCCSSSVLRSRAFRDAFQLTTTGQSDYPGYCSLPVSSNQSGRSPLISHISEEFRSTEPPCTGCYAVDKKCSTQPIRHQQPCHRMVKITLFPILMADVNITQSSYLLLRKWLIN